MALYSAKEAKWYRRNVERREHRFFFNRIFFFLFFILLLLPHPHFPSLLVLFPLSLSYLVLTLPPFFFVEKKKKKKR